MLKIRKQKYLYLTPVISVIALLLIGGVSYAAFAPKKVETVDTVRKPHGDVNTTHKTKTKATVKKTTTKKATKKVAKVNKTAPVKSAAVATVLSTQEYAEKYLDLSGNNQEAFDLIVSTWPERFTPSVRENNVKALRAFASVRAAVSFGPNYGIIFKSGKHGEFFDSELAKKYW